MAKGDKITLGIDFYAKSVSSSEYSDPKVGLENSSNCYLIDDKAKNKKDNDWGPYNSISVQMQNQGKSKILFGKKYRVTFEEL